jgi:amidohydrolase
MTAPAADAGGRAAAVERAAGRHRTDVAALARRIYETPELSGEEHRAAAWCREILARHGFAVEPVPGVKTAFVATLRGGGGPGPTIGLLAEYDALPGVGHGCGHHLIAGSAVGAALAVAEVLPDLPGTLRVFGCPAEEIGQGKPAMLAAGAFAGTDAALTYHAQEVTSVQTASTGAHGLDFHFRGRPAHAASDPWAGASALDGVLLTYQGINALRQFLRDGARIHGIVTHGGDAWNVVPERASCRVGVRAAAVAELDRMVARARACAQGAALASGTELQIETWLNMEPTRFNPPLAELATRHLERLGHAVQPLAILASTDFGNVSQALPALTVSVATWPRGTAFHTLEAAEAAGRPEAFDAMHGAGLAMALTAADLLAERSHVERAAAAFRAAGEGA